jgi:LPS export ABC transporter permease LptG/LPS export ABC transporter permease LptF
MLRLIDRYVIREVLTPFAFALALFTFVLLVNPLMDEARRLIEKGVGTQTILRILATLAPQALGITIPIALLVGLLVGLGRLSADREAVALQACGVSLTRLLRPVALVSVLATLATTYVMVVAIPNGNRSYQSILADVVAARIESEIKPRVFFEDFPNLTLYARDVSSAGGGWRDVFIADRRDPKQPQILVARHGQLIIDRSKQKVDLVLEHGSQHRLNKGDEAKYEVQTFTTQTIGLDPAEVFPKTQIVHGAPEMTIAELRAEIEQRRKQGLSTHNETMYIHQKFSIPVACLVFGLIALCLGITNSKDSKHASFVIGLAVVFVYWMFFLLGQAMARAKWLPPELARWVPDILLGAVGIVLLVWRHRYADAGVQLTLPSPQAVKDGLRHLQAKALARFRPGSRPNGEPHQEGAAPIHSRPEGAASAPPSQLPGTSATRPRPPHRKGVVLVIRVPQGWLPRLRLLDAYVSKAYLRIAALAFAGMLGIFYIASFIDWSDNLFKGQATGMQLALFMWYSTPQYVYYVLPLAALVATLVTIGLLTRSSELIVMRACGVSLYRTAVPLLVFALLWSGALLALEETVLAKANREAAELKHLMRGGSPRTFNVMARQWVTGRDGRLYHYNYFDPRTTQLSELEIYKFDDAHWRILERTQARAARYDSGSWSAERGWSRGFKEHVVTAYAPFNTRRLALESPGYFGTEQPDAERMTFTDLRRYIATLKVSGFDVVPFTVALHRKISFPFVALVMTLLGIPFAVTTGRRGALYGIGLAIILAISYWGLFAVFTAIGSAGMLSPVLAAWAPNVLFVTAATALLLTVRT